jgi:hypothetical protein
MVATVPFPFRNMGYLFHQGAFAVTPGFGERATGPARLCRRAACKHLALAQPKMRRIFRLLHCAVVCKEIL